MATKTTKKEEQDIWCLLMEELNTTWCILAKKRKKKSTLSLIKLLVPTTNLQNTLALGRQNQ